MLDTASYGAYAMDMYRRILFWNRSAKRIVGYEAEQVVGRQCYEVLYGLPTQPSVSACGGGCLTLHLAESRRIAAVAHVRMLCASGERKRVAVMTLVVPGSQAESPMLVHLFHEQTTGAWAERGPRSVHAKTAPRLRMGSPGRQARGNVNPLTPRELEVVRLLAAGEGIASIGERLHLSTHTVLNYVRNAREKLYAPNRLALVLTAQRLGLL